MWSTCFHVSWTERFIKNSFYYGIKQDHLSGRTSIVCIRNGKIIFEVTLKSRSEEKEPHQTLILGFSTLGILMLGAG